jgi:Flp pilus assembly protein TadG
VELALVSTILFTLLFAIVDYGLWFNDSLNTRQGVREGARRAVVENFTVPTGSPCAAQQGATRMACIAQQLISPSAGEAYVRVVVPAGWKRGNPVLVCGMTKVDGLTHMVPLPSSGLVHTKMQMSIEVDTTPINNGVATSATTGTPSGASWGWCT